LENNAGDASTEIEQQSACQLRHERAIATETEVKNRPV
jgi:hypothetical protein